MELGLYTFAELNRDPDAADPALELGPLGRDVPGPQHRARGLPVRQARPLIISKGRFTKRFKVRETGAYRLRYGYKGSSLVAAGRVTEAIRIRRRVFFG